MGSGNCALSTSSSPGIGFSDVKHSADPEKAPKGSGQRISIINNFLVLAAARRLRDCFLEIGHGFVDVGEVKSAYRCGRENLESKSFGVVNEIVLHRN